MSVFKLELGAEIDVATGDELSGARDDILSSLKDGRPPRPTYTSRAASLTGTGAIPAHLDLGSPPAGRIWNVRAVTVSGADPFTAPASTPKWAMYFGRSGAVGPAQLKLVGGAVPGTQFPSGQALWCHSNENLIIVVSGIIATTENISATAEVAEWRTRDITQDSGRP